MPSARLERRAAWTFVELALAAIALVSGAFLVLDIPIPEWLVLVGRWIPGLLAILVIKAYALPGGLRARLGVLPGSWPRLVLGSLLGAVALAATYAATAYFFARVMQIELQSWAFIGQAIALAVPLGLLFVLSTAGEEIAWRGFLQHAFRRGGFWRASAGVSAIWVLFHVPLHAAMAAQGAFPWAVAAATTAALFGLGIFLSALAVRFGSIWPAALAHAVPVGAINFLADGGALPAGQIVAATLLAGLALLLVGGLLARGIPAAIPERSAEARRRPTFGPRSSTGTAPGRLLGS
ncbi:CAAX amino terminal protease family protein [Gulosibacter sp. 10]|nr:CAAX amino terminal protease family protein [Gulosibacter sp. 10]